MFYHKSGHSSLYKGPSIKFDVSSSQMLHENHFSLVWYHAPVVPAAQESEAGRSLDPRSSRPAWVTDQNCLKVMMITK